HRECYGELIRVEFLKKLRDEEKYVDLPTLTAAIERDADDARAYFERQDAAATSATDRI
ncbi:MAG TPA: riboflavin kinase, partial [Noviherbaspirillum sp.]|uniref:riboflavin kinase n=1 Tax=Noviherbaspirillum sp. TaxID=1926288 RepID=UPI002DDD3F9C